MKECKYYLDMVLHENGITLNLRWYKRFKRNVDEIIVLKQYTKVMQRCIL